MELSSFLKPEAVRVFGTLSSKKRLFQDLADIADSAYGLKASMVLDALQERESLGPTGVGHGVALPHARIDGLDSVTGAFVRLERPLDFDSVDRQPVDLVFALFAPRESGVDHLKALASGVAPTAQQRGLQQAAGKYRPIDPLYDPYGNADVAGSLKTVFAPRP